jgi:superfamily II DNA/RNA helicase
MLFDELNLNNDLLESIEYMGFKEATPVQEMAIPVILSGNDLIACAQTGTGKTAAYLVPILNNIAGKRSGHVHTLVLVPTRELAIQIDQQIQGLGYTLNITSIAVYGGAMASAGTRKKLHCHMAQI